jgi:hypothetical protein
LLGKILREAREQKKKLLKEGNILIFNKVLISDREGIEINLKRG